MKTNLNKSLSRRNLQRAALRTAAVIVSFVLISFTVTAQDFWKQLLTNNGISEMAMVLVDQPAEAIIDDVETSEEGATSEATTFFNYFEVINENTLELENWMLNEYYFGSFSSYEMLSAEMPVQLENWMLNDAYFNSETTNDDALVLEDWMTNDNHWAL